MTIGRDVPRERLPRHLLIDRYADKRRSTRGDLKNEPFDVGSNQGDVPAERLYRLAFPLPSSVFRNSAESNEYVISFWAAWRARAISMRRSTSRGKGRSLASQR